MSNKLIRLAQRVTTLSIDGAARPIRQSEKAVLVTLADDARDAAGDCSTLSLHEISRRASIARRTVDFAMVALADAGLIMRVGGPGRRAAVTRLFLTPDSHQMRTGFASDANLHRIRCESDSQVESYHYPIDQRPVAGARANEVSGFRGPAPEPVPAAPEPPPLPVPAERELDPVDQVFAAWDAWRDRAGLQGPVTRNAARRIGVARAIEEYGLGKVLMSIDTVERGFKAGRFRRRHAVGQDDLWATFDALFDVGHARALNLLARLCDGEFGTVVPAAAPAVRESRATDPDEPDPVRRLRDGIRARIGEDAARQWIDPLRFDWRDGELLATAPGAFHADWVTSNYAGELRGAAGGAAVRVLVREKV